jgi:pSer/pThr/pTyr-binding forkhead associated (FHA) protein
VASSSTNGTTQPIGALIVSGNARLVVVGGLCPPGLTFTLGKGEHEAGRASNGIQFKEDETVSPKHCTFISDDKGIRVRDEASLNGVYVRVRGKHALAPGDWFRVGQQTFRFERLELDETFSTEDGTHVFTSPRRKGTFRVQQVLEGGGAGLSSTSSNDELTIGGEGCTIAFTADPHLSAKHCKISVDADGSAFIEDLNSTNGTYLRVCGEHPLAHGDYVYVGNELLRLEVV